MELICYVKPGWAPRIRPASQKREWMDATQDSFAYRCLPLNIANAHGWELLSPCGFSARWSGGKAADAVEIRVDDGTAPHQAPVSLFGHGTLTFHVEGLFRTPEGWNLWVGGSPNAPKDAIAPLGGVVETDWSPYTFTMNWRFTRAGQWVRFDENEPICFFFPVERDLIGNVAPRLVPLADDPGLDAGFDAWSRSRNAFQEQVRTAAPGRASETWQKLYYRGVHPDGSPGPASHRSKLKPQPFRTADGAALDFPPPRRCPAAAHSPAAEAAPALPAADALALRRREWILEVMERQRALSVKARSIHRCEGISSEAFLDRYYAPGRPVLLAGEMADWPALRLWSPDYLKRLLGNTPIEVQAGRAANPAFELEKHLHRKTMAFAEFLEQATAGAANDIYLTASNSDRNGNALQALEKDLRHLTKFVDPTTERSYGMPWIGGAGTFTPLHHDLTNNLLAQLVGRKRIVLAPPSEARKLYNRVGVFSDVLDLDRARRDTSRFPLAADVRTFELVLSPGEVLFIPIGWWHQVTALDFSVSFTLTNFLWPNDAWSSFPE